MFLNQHLHPKCWSCRTWRWRMLITVSVQTILIIHLNKRSHHFGTFAVELPNDCAFRRLPPTATEMVQHGWQHCHSIILSCDSCLLFCWMCWAVTDTPMTYLYCCADDLLLIATLPLLLSPRDLLAANCEIWAFSAEENSVSCFISLTPGFTKWTARHQWQFIKLSSVSLSFGIGVYVRKHWGKWRHRKWKLQIWFLLMLRPVSARQQLQ